MGQSVVVDLFHRRGSSFSGRSPVAVAGAGSCVVLWRTLGSCPGLRRSDLESAEYPLASLSLFSFSGACVYVSVCVSVCQRLGSGGGDEEHLCGVLSSVDMCL